MPDATAASLSARRVERSPVLSVRGLDVVFDTVSGPVHAVRGVDLDLRNGEILGLVGETGSGKSVTCKALTRLLPSSARISGEVLYDGADLVKVAGRRMPSYRGRAIAMIFQDPLSCLNPIKTIYSHLKEVLRLDGTARPADYRERAVHALRARRINSPNKRLRDYPFQFSGGMAQRVQIAMALAGSPRVLVADEPTTALDVTIQSALLRELKRLAVERNLSVIFVTHDLAVVAETCDRVAVMYHGRIVESGDTTEVLASPCHPYTRGLLSTIPDIEKGQRRLTAIVGEGLPATVEVPGCDFAPRCPRADERCNTEKPRDERRNGRQFVCFHPHSGAEQDRKAESLPSDQRPAGEMLLSVRGLSCVFDIRGETGEIGRLAAVDDASFDVCSGEILGIVGESGSGKSTLAKAMIGLLPPTRGEISYRGKALHGTGFRYKDYARRVQYVFQDPLGALDPRMTILDQTIEPLSIHRIGTPRSREGLARSMLKRCGLDDTLYDRKPYGLSGGQRQRAVLARALVCEPELLICDEPVSAMDVSVQAQILNLVRDLAERDGVTVVFISHDLAVIHSLCTRVAVMYAGQIVEIGPLASIFRSPAHPYTQLLIDSIPSLESAFRREIEAGEEQTAHPAADERARALGATAPAAASFTSPPSADPAGVHDIPTVGCPYVPRCPLAMEICSSERPAARPFSDPEAAPRSTTRGKAHTLVPVAIEGGEHRVSCYAV